MPRVKAKVSANEVRAFQHLVLAHYAKHKRDLPWRHGRTPYRVAVVEIMLQQTQVPRVVPKFSEFIRRFPTFRSLSTASQADVLAAWSGLGYNRRALLLRKLAQAVVQDHGGRLPRTVEQLQELPGLGHATAAAISVYAYGQPHAFIETNVRAVLLHHFFPGKKNVPDAKVWPLIHATLDRRDPIRWYSALMDYGTHLKKQVVNPSRQSKHYSRPPKFVGSNRQLRGQVLKAVLNAGSTTAPALAKKFSKASSAKIEGVIEQLVREGYIRRQGRRIAVVQ
jgi:A/G-specific adenine glycosylase